MREKLTIVPDELANRLREASRRFGNGSTGLTDADVDAAAAARRAFREAQIREGALDPEAFAIDWSSSLQAVGAAACQIEEEARADVRSGIRSDLLLGLVPAVVVVGGMTVVSQVFDLVIQLRWIAILGVVLMGFAVYAMLEISGVVRSSFFIALGASVAQRMLVTSAGTLGLAAALIIVSGVALSIYTEQRLAEAGRLATSELQLIDSSVAIALLAQQAGVEPTRALNISERMTGLDWSVELRGLGDRGYVTAKTNLANSEAFLTYPLTRSPLEGKDLPQSRLVAENGKVLGSRTYLIAKIAEQPALSSNRVMLATDSTDTTKTYSLSIGVSVPPVGTAVVATLKDNSEVVNLQPVDWLSERVNSKAVKESRSAVESQAASPAAAAVSGEAAFKY